MPQTNQSLEEADMCKRKNSSIEHLSDFEGNRMIERVFSP